MPGGGPRLRRMDIHSHHCHQPIPRIALDLTALHAARSGPIPSPTQRAPREVHVRLEARESTIEIEPGRRVIAWAFEGTVPGPTIVARVGDTLVATLVNHLPEPTVIHWHGLRVPSHMDGTEIVQTTVQPGETYEYRFVLPDAGTFWYHSHANETVQVERGLYGAIVVLAEDEPTFDDDRLLVLDDMKLDRHDRIKDTSIFDRHNGREGSTLLVNGLVAPEIEIAAGHVERWRFVNASNARYVLLSIGGRPFRVIARSGGMIAQEVSVTETLITPGDRVEIAVGPFEEEGARIPIESLPYKRSNVAWSRRDEWATLRVGPAKARRATPAIGAVIEPLTDEPLHPTRTIRLGARMTFHGHDWLVNDETHHRAEPVKVGELQVWEIVNETGLDHPFHLHGFFFQVVAIDGQAITPIAWEDTVNVRAKRRLTIAFRPDDRPGEWMFHCHILEHHAAGMMGHFEVVRAV